MRQIYLLSLLSLLFHVSPAESKINISTSGLEAIYGIDDRELVSNKSHPKVKELAKSVALIVSTDHLEAGIFKTTIKALSLQEAAGMCVSERFVTRPALSACTGFLVGPNLLLSAGHCFQDESDCSNKKIIFEVDEKKQTKNGYSVYNSNVFSCSRIISNRYDSMAPELEDYALIELDRVVKRRTPLKLNLGKKISNDDQVFMIGHPFGMPLMLSRKSRLINNAGEFQFSAGLDSFIGNSGAPVFNAKTFLVEGILVNGQQDLVQDLNIECYRNKVHDGSGGEGVFRANKLPSIFN